MIEGRKKFVKPIKTKFRKNQEEKQFDYKPKVQKGDKNVRSKTTT